MKHKAINLVASINGKDLSYKSIESFEMERNFADVSNKFTMVIIDSPHTSMTDLELYMAGGYRQLSVSYNDSPNKEDFVSFKGQIYDYTSAFVGNIKKLTISGYLTRATNYDTSGRATYNIDWNSYYNMRKDVGDFWNVTKMVHFSRDKRGVYIYRMEQSYDKDYEDYKLYNSDVVYKEFVDMYNTNSIMVKIKGPVGSIEIPYPDSFCTMNITTKTDKDGNVIEYGGDFVDKNNKLWGALEPHRRDRTNSSTDTDSKPEWVSVKNMTKISVKEAINDSTNVDIFWIQKGTSNIRAFKLKEDDTHYIQMNPEKEYYGAGAFLNNNLGVDPSYIVKMLCKLEGWPYTESTIVQTDLVPNSDAFRMNNKSAIEFINDVLIPVSVTPVGNYYNKNGEITPVKTGETGFTFYFDSSGYAHFEPLGELWKRDKRHITFGYNLPNSPVISFQVDTKGTCFYTTNAQKISTLSITTGQQYEEVTTSSEQSVLEYNKVSGHNESLDKYFGYTYSEIKKMYDNASSSTNGMYLGFGSNATIGVTSVDENPNTGVGTQTTNYISGNIAKGLLTGDAVSIGAIDSSAVQKNLVTIIPSSGSISASQVSTALADARGKIEKFMLTATMSIWGNTEISPASIISVTNMVKSANDVTVDRHPTSGDYLILKQKDIISKDAFTQQLSLLRANATLTDQINPLKIDYTKRVVANEDKTDKEIQTEHRVEEQNKSRVSWSSKITSLWSDYRVGLFNNNKITFKESASKEWDINNQLQVLGALCSSNKDFNHSCKISDPDALKRIKLRPGIGSDIQKQLQEMIDTAQYVYDPYVSLLVYNWYYKALEAKADGTLGKTLLHTPPGNTSDKTTDDYFNNKFPNYKPPGNNSYLNPGLPNYFNK